jgi:hypothetical protein
MNNIKKDSKGMPFEDVNWIQLAWDRVQWQALVNTITNLRIPYYARNF